MLDMKLIRDHPNVVRENLRKRGKSEKIEMLDKLVALDKEWRHLLTQANEVRHRRKLITTEIAGLKKNGEDTTKKIEEAQAIPERIKKLERKIREHKRKIDYFLLRLPNLVNESVPLGKDESDNVVIRHWGEPPKFGFKPKSHLELLQNLRLIDVKSAAKVTGSAFYYLKGSAVLLDLALQRFAAEFLMARGFQILEPPLMVNKRSYEGMIGDPFDFAEASYKIDGEDLYLIPTAEYPLGSMFTDKVFVSSDLPLRLCGISACFRKEVGTHGKYSKGLFRVHQFNKVEQFVFCLPEDSWAFFEELQKNSEELYQKLGLHYRVTSICSGDLSAKAAKAYDVEVWMSDGEFRESGSNSNCTDYQARRLNIRYREKEGKRPAGFVHTLNNTALATSRTIVAILEQFQQEDGSIIVPSVLRPFMGGTERLS